MSQLQITDPVIAKLELCCKQLAECSSVQDAQSIADMAVAARSYATQCQLGLDVKNHATYIILCAERRIGEILQVGTRANGADRGGRKKKLDGTRELPSNSPPTLSEIGVSKKLSARSQKLAALDDDTFEKTVSENRATVKGNDTKELTLKAVLQAAAQHKNEPETSSVIDIPKDCRFVKCLSELEGERFSCVYADPPWRYDNQGTRASTDNHYPTMTADEVCEWGATKLTPLLADDCHLWLWTTNAFLFDSPRILEAWGGFEFKSAMVWVKPQMGLGNYVRCAHEYLLLGVRGRPEFRDHSIRSWHEVKRGRHSEKPEIFRELIEKASPPEARLELFGRVMKPGWTIYGNELLPAQDTHAA